MSDQRKRKMFISVLPDEMLELALTEDGELREYYVEMSSQAKTKGNIYKGVVHNVDPALQAAFVSYGAKKNGFLQVDEVHPEYYQREMAPTKGFRYPPLHKVIKPGQELLVQVVKEPIGAKGAYLTTYLSLPGRFFVLTLGKEQTGVSRKIEDEKERERLKEVVASSELGEGMGTIVRTVSEGQSKRTLAMDIKLLKGLWEEIRAKGIAAPSPSCIYEEKELAFRAVRDYLTPDVTEIWVDDEETFNQIQELVSLIFPRRKKMIRRHGDPSISLFQRFHLTEQIAAVYSRRVTLPSGCELVIDTTEAMTTIDINSGKIGGKTNFKDMALKTNSEAAQAIPTQLKLRDIGGQVVIDFIEMKDPNHVREVEKTFRAAIKSDRARTDVGRISKFGLLEMVRQRTGSSAIALSTENCSCCDGTGRRRRQEWLALAELKLIHSKGNLLSSEESEIVHPVNPDLAIYLLNEKRERILALENLLGRKIRILPT